MLGQRGALSYAERVVLLPDYSLKLSVRHLAHILELCYILILKSFVQHRCADLEIVVGALGTDLFDVFRSGRPEVESSAAVGVFA